MAKKELAKVNATDEPAKEAIKEAETSLDEGLKTLEKRQKHIKVADRSEFGWATVEHYESHPLATDSDDEKRLDKAEKEAERAANNRRRGSSATGIKKSLSGGAGPSSRPRELQIAAPPSCYPKYQQGCHEFRYWGHVFPVDNMATWPRCVLRKQCIL